MQENQDRTKIAEEKPSVSAEATSGETLKDIEDKEGDVSPAPGDATPSPDGQFPTAGGASVKEDPGPM